MLKTDYPKAIADLLGIPAVQGSGGPWLSTQGTVIAPWLQALAEALDVPYTTKVETMRRLVESVGGTWDPITMASTQTSSGGGSNISTPAFVEFYSRLQADPVAQRKRAFNRHTPAFRAPTVPSTADDKTVWQAVRARRGQPWFRQALLDAYHHRCAITHTDIPEVLEAAHIVPYGQGGTYETSNGLLLRADLHTLFDARLLTFDPSTLKVLLHPRIAGRAHAEDLALHTLRSPKAGHEPSQAGLAAHRTSCDF